MEVSTGKFTASQEALTESEVRYFNMGVESN